MSSFAIPYLLGAVSGAGSYLNPNGIDADFDIGGILFLSASTEENPYQRTMAKVAKDRVDNSANPGDNSLTGWWLRSQTDWSLGAGQDFMEPIAADGVDRGFDASAGVDPFTVPGSLSLLPLASSVSTVSTAANPLIVTLSNGYIFAAGTTVRRVVDGVTTNATAAGTVTSLTIAGPNVLVCSSGLIEWAPLSGAFTLTTGFTCTGIPRAWWVKSRILIAIGSLVHEHPGSVIVGSTDLTAATPLYDLLDSTATVVSMTTTPRAIIAAVNSNSGSVIMAFELDANGTLPTASAPVVVAEFPVSETLLGIASYLGAFIGLATSAGIRVATVGDNGSITYGPLIGSPVATGVGNAFTALDRFLHYVTADAGDGRGGLVRVDLSELSETGRAAWSTFVRAPAGVVVTDAVVTGLRTAYMVAADGGTARLYKSEDANGLDSGWLLTSAVRYGTLEPKDFDLVKVSVDTPMAGSLFVQMEASDGTPIGMGTMTGNTGDAAAFKVATHVAVSHMRLRFDLTPDGLAGPSLASWQMRAYPMISQRGEGVVLPLYNFDFEKDAHGVPFGYEGYAHSRWVDLLARVTDGSQLVVQELRSGATYAAIAEDMVFRQTSPPSTASGFGGIINLQLRTT